MLAFASFTYVTGGEAFILHTTEQTFREISVVFHDLPRSGFSCFTGHGCGVGSYHCI